MAICHFYKPQTEYPLARVSKQPKVDDGVSSHHHRSWWTITRRRNAMRGWGCVWRGVKLFVGMLAWSMQVTHAWKLQWWRPFIGRGAKLGLAEHAWVLGPFGSVSIEPLKLGWVRLI
ncbi:Sarcosine dehydrogenase-2C mitochondrial [Gossypium arboreum]|uniref:Sarcosine dehydrogenase-2C mitochondrial n=1 Tax=Gossypium arboreum TaxID=29729 RepID=A0A0B0NND6_GOSAR|nr:Sarcosine dehydrogenase-2C mitochondrial [Gossypium arboreum]